VHEELGSADADDEGGVGGKLPAHAPIFSREAVTAAIGATDF
jgi:hypothetical protein